MFRPAPRPLIPLPLRLVAAGVTWTVCVLAVSSCATRATGLETAGVADPLTTGIQYAEAAPLLEALPEHIPADLKGKSLADVEAEWPSWTARYNAGIRARLSLGDEESIVNFWRHGTSFTKQPRLTERTVAQLGRNSDAEQAILRARLDDLIAGIERPGPNERLQFARNVVERQGIDPTTPAGRDEARRFLIATINRTASEEEARSRRLESTERLGDSAAELLAHNTVFRDRGISTDTTIASSFSIERALTGAKSRGVLREGAIVRVAIVGPGLDFSDKQDGYDFYPQQTLQPFGVVDSLIRLGLATPGAFRMTTFDLSARINDHLRLVRQRAAAGMSSVLQLPLDADEAWNPDLVAFWERFGDRIGAEVPPIAAPAEVGRVRVRAVAIRPDIVLAITPRDLNIVLERRLPQTVDDQFDLIVATNILPYYDVLEQNLALANAASMLRPGGLFLTNTLVVPAISMRLLDDYDLVAHKGSEGDRMFWYRREP